MAHEIQAGDWKSLMEDRSISAHDRQSKVKQFAKHIEDRALRKEHILKQKKNTKKPPMSASQNRNQDAKPRALSSQRNEYNHPMGKLNVSSVHAPSDIQSMMASPEQ